MLPFFLPTKTVNMLKNKFIKLTFLATIICLVACNSGKKYELKLRLNDGDQFTQNMLTDMNMDMEMMGQTMKMNMKNETECLFQVIKNNAGDKQLKLTYTKMDMSTKMGGNAGLSQDATDSVMKKQSAMIVGKSMLITLDKTNKVIDVQGMDSLTSAGMPEESKKIMEKMFSKEQVNSMWGMMFSMYPDKAVAVGDKWNRNITIDVAGLEMEIKYTYTLTDVKDNIAFLKVDGVIDSKGKMKNLPVEIEAIMKGKQSGTLSIGVDNGYIKNADYTMDLNAEMELMGKRMPMKMTGVYKLKGK